MLCSRSAAILLALVNVACPKKEVSQKEVQVQILAINDFHGQLVPPTRPVPTAKGEVPAGGAAYLATHLTNLRQKAKHTVFISAGDLFGGSPLLSALFHDEPTIEAMNLMGLDIHAVGNHELDEGLQELLRMKQGGCHPKDGCRSKATFEGSRFSFLGANTFKEKKLVFPAYEVRTFDGVQVAFIGATLRSTQEFVPPQIIPELAFRDEAETVNAIVADLKKEGIEAFVLVLHEGAITKGMPNDCNNLTGPLPDIIARLDKAVDVVLSAHTHRWYNCRIDGRIVTNAGSAGRLVTQIQLTIDPVSKDVKQARAENIVVTHDVAPNKKVTELVDRYRAIAQPLEQRQIGTITAEISKKRNEAGESPIGGVIADAQLSATAAKDKGGAVAAFLNSGGARAGFDFREGGHVTFGDAFSVQPFANWLLTMTLTGAQIRQLLEEQWKAPKRPRMLQVSATFQYRYDDKRAFGEKVDPKSIRIDGKVVDPKASYRLTTNSFLANRGVLGAGTDRLAGVVDIEALEAYFKKHSPVAPPAPGRFVRKNGR